METIDQLLQPITVRNLEMPIRAVMPPMGPALGSADNGHRGSQGRLGNSLKTNE